MLDLTKVTNLDEWQLAFVAEGDFGREAYLYYAALLLRLIIESKIFPYLNKDPLVAVGSAEIVTVKAEDGMGSARASLRNFRLPSVLPFKYIGLEAGEESADGRGLYFPLDSIPTCNIAWYKSRAWGITMAKKIVIIEFSLVQSSPAVQAGLSEATFRGVSWEELLAECVSGKLPAEGMLEDIIGYLSSLEERRQELLRQVQRRIASTKELVELLELKKKAMTAGFCSSR